MIISLALTLALGLACGDKDTPEEGTQPGDCSDAADNDGDGLFDCEDDGCAGSPDCTGGDGGATGDGGSDGGGLADGGALDGGALDGGGTDGGGTDGGGTDGGGTDGGGTDGGGTDGGGTDGGGTDGGGTDGGGTDGGAGDGGSSDTECTTESTITATLGDGSTVELTGAAWEAKITGAKILLVEKGNPCELAAAGEFPGVHATIEWDSDVAEGDTITVGPKATATGLLETADGTMYGMTGGSLTVDDYAIESFLSVSAVDVELEFGDGALSGDFRACYCDYVVPKPTGEEGDTGLPPGDGGFGGGGGGGGGGG